MRIEYAGSVHDEEEIQAVVDVLRGGPTALRIGKRTKEMERLVAETFGKRRGIMCNSGSSALYLAIELLGLSMPPERQAGKIVGEGPDAVAQLVTLLRTEAKVL